ncbi:hypothetical protein ABZP36_023321, partial [Zizania latifolia]
HYTEKYLPLGAATRGNSAGTILYFQDARSHDMWRFRSPTGAAARATSSPRDRAASSATSALPPVIPSPSAALVHFSSSTAGGPPRPAYASSKPC